MRRLLSVPTCCCDAEVSDIAFNGWSPVFVVVIQDIGWFNVAATVISKTSGNCVHLLYNKGSSCHGRSMKKLQALCDLIRRFDELGVTEGNLWVR